MRSSIGWRHHLASAAAGACLLSAACGIGNNSDEMPGFNDQAAQAGRAPGSAAPGGAASPEGVASGTMSRSEDQLAAQAQASDTQGTGGAGTGAMETAAAPMSDNTIFATIASANEAEIEAGKIAQGKATNASVRAFANDMVREHTALQQQAQQLATKLELAPQPLANDSIAARSNTHQTALSSASGAAFDRQYMEFQVADHESTLAMLRQAERAAANPELKSFIRGAIPNVEQHLTRARDIRSKLGGGT